MSRFYPKESGEYALSPYSHEWIHRRPNLRYTNSYMSSFNNQHIPNRPLDEFNDGIFGNYDTTTKLQKVNDKIQDFNNIRLKRNLGGASTRPAFIGLDGEINIPIPSLSPNSRILSNNNYNKGQLKQHNVQLFKSLASCQCCNLEKRRRKHPVVLF